MADTGKFSLAEHRSEFEDWIRIFQEDLNLTHWRIELSNTPAAPNTFLQVVTTRPRNHAAIRVSAGGVPADRMQQLMKHELLHLVIDPIREEHDFQMAALATERKNEYSERMLRAVERAVEHLSHVV